MGQKGFLQAGAPELRLKNEVDFGRQRPGRDHSRQRKMNCERQKAGAGKRMLEKWSRDYSGFHPTNILEGLLCGTQ